MTENYHNAIFSEMIQGCMRLAEWQWSDDTCLRWIDELVELGVTTFDHAHVYGNPSCESLFGRALKLRPQIRDSIQIITKCGIHLPGQANSHEIPYYDTSKSAIISSVDTSLTRLGVDYVDALLIHRPDVLLDADEVTEAFDQLHHSGKVRLFGVSNFLPDQFSLLQSRLKAPLITNQIEISPIHMQALEDGTLDQLQKLRIRPMAWSCLGGGRIFHEGSPQAIRLRETLEQLAHDFPEASPEQLVLCWVRSLPSSPRPVLGTGQIERVKHALKALDLTMTRNQWYRIWTAAKGHQVP